MTPDTLSKDLIEMTFDFADRIQNGRDVPHVVDYLTTELGELAEELLHLDLNTGMAGKDGVAGEGVDVALCALDLIRVDNPNRTAKDLKGMIPEHIYSVTSGEDVISIIFEKNKDTASSTHSYRGVASIARDLGLLKEMCLIAEGSTYKEYNGHSVEACGLHITLNALNIAFAAANANDMTLDDVIEIAHKKLMKWEAKHSAQIRTKKA